MKKTIAFLFGILVFISCTTADSNDANDNPTTTVVPVAPTNLIATVFSANQVNLSWTDNSTNETGFKIERKTGTGTYTVVGSTLTDITIFNDTGLTPNTTYIYRVYSYNTAGNSPTYSNEVTVATTAALLLPTLTTSAVSSIATATAVSGGIISSDGGAAVTAKGVCWSTSANPTVALTTKTNDGSGTSVFTSNITGLTANTTYYVRAYATNSVGTAYGSQVSFTSLQNSTAINVNGPSVTDIDGNVYASVTNCGQTWTKSNLNVSKYSDGTTIPQATSREQWVNSANNKTGAWCYSDIIAVGGPVLGKLYNIYAVAGIYDAASLANPALRKKLAPTGWHIPSDADWSLFTTCLGGESIAGGKMKATDGWIEPNTGATNESGFTGLAQASLSSGNNGIQSGFSARFWSVPENETNQNGYLVSWIRYLGYDTTDVRRFSYSNAAALSVRSVKD
jgi:uncharacterized protein (TIGR02145 family)